MNKKSFWVFLAFLVLLTLLVYSVFWFGAARKAEEAFVNGLQTWRVQSGNNAHISYEKLSRGGYPTHITLTLTQPRFDFQPTQDQPWKVQGSVDGDVKLSLPVWSKEPSVIVDGTLVANVTHRESKQNIQQKIQWQGHTEWKQKVDTSHFEQLNNFLRTGSAITGGDFTWPESYELHATLDHATHSFSDKEKELLILTAGPAQIDIEKEDKEKPTQELTYAFDIHNFKTKYEHAALPETTISEAFNKYFSYDPALYNDTDLYLSGKLCFPSHQIWNEITENPWQPRQAKFCLTVDRLDWKNPMALSHMRNWILSLDQNGGKYAFIFKGKSDKEVYAAYDTLLTEKMTDFLKSPPVVDAVSQGDQQSQTQFLRHIPDLVALLPQLHKWGLIDASIDLKVDVDLDQKKNANNIDEVHLNKLHIDLADAKYVINPYTFEYQQKVDYDAGMTNGRGEATLSISHYKELVDMLISYNNRVSETFSSLNLTSLPQLPLFKPEHTAHILSFLQDLSEKKDSSDLKIKFSIGGEEGWRVGTMTPAQFIIRSIELGNNLQSAWPQ